MKKGYFYWMVLLLVAEPSFAGITDIFKDANGKTNWQILANWTSGTLIILLSIVAVSLFVARRNAYRANLELSAIRRNLELRVRERTATLDQSNRLLKESNQKLASEVESHIETTEKLAASEAYTRDILTSMPLMLIGLDSGGRVTQWNRRIEEVSGISAEQAIGKTLWEAYPTVTIAPEQIQQALSRNTPIHFRQSLRSLSHYDITIYPLKGQATPGVVVLVDDVTKQTTAENMLIHNDKMSFMGELASTMAHDINVPLQAVLLDLKSFQRVLSEDSAEGQAERLHRIVSDMSQKGDQVAAIIRNLLSFARGRQHEKQAADMVEVMNSTLRIASEMITDQQGLRFDDITIERHFSDQLPAAPCYVTELQQVLLSLLRHCMLALAEGTREAPTIKILLTECYDSLWIKVQHNGKGLTSEEQMYLFEPFFSQATPETSYDAGERLSFPYYIITEQHQGHMAVTSDVAVGTTFHIQLPLES